MQSHYRATHCRESRAIDRNRSEETTLNASRLAGEGKVVCRTGTAHFEIRMRWRQH
jgi:hypothetical protein